MAAMITINLKPVSVNELYSGKRYVTPKGRKYKEAVQWLCPKVPIPEGKLHIRYRFYFSSTGSDIDNALKGFTDSLSSRLGFNDNRVYRIDVEKLIVPKGQEKIEFEILPYQ